MPGLNSPYGKAIVVCKHDCSVETDGKEEGKAKLCEYAIIQLEDGADGPE